MANSIFLSFLQIYCLVASPTVDLGKIEARMGKKFLFLQCKGVTEIQGKMNDGCPPYSTVKIWLLRFQIRYLKVIDEPQSGQPASTIIEDKINNMNLMILADFQISAKVIAETQGISLKELVTSSTTFLTWENFLQNECQNSWTQFRNTSEWWHPRQFWTSLQQERLFYD